MDPSSSPGSDIGPDIDRRGMHRNRSSGPAVNGTASTIHSDLNADDLEEDTPGTTMRYIRQHFPNGNVIGMPGVFALPIYEPLDESTDPPLSHLQNGTGNGLIYQNSHHTSDSSLDDLARGTSPWVSEATRLDSFHYWPYSTVPPTIRPEDLAKDGFRYVGPLDTVQCVFCRQRLKNWEEGDTVRGEHQRYKPSCPMLCGHTTHNVPLTDEDRSAILQTHANRGQLPRGELSRELPRELPRGVPPSEESSLEAPRAKHPQYSVEATRLASFKEWPTQMHQKPEELSKAGFFYLNRGDIVCCFFCGETVMEWERDDDAWVEHARISPNCYFVEMVKGEGFIQMAKKGVHMHTCGGIGFIVNCLRRIFWKESESVEALLEKPAALALRHDGVGTEELTVALARMIQRHAGQDVYSANAIKAELSNIAQEKKAAQTKLGLRGAAAVPKEAENSASEKGVRDLEEENRQLREQRTCKVCLESEISIIFLPCGHLVCCASCGLALNECPICRQHITKTTKAFWA